MPDAMFCKRVCYFRCRETNSSACFVPYGDIEAATRREALHQDFQIPLHDVGSKMCEYRKGVNEVLFLAG